MRISKLNKTIDNKYVDKYCLYLWTIAKCRLKYQRTMLVRSLDCNFCFKWTIYQRIFTSKIKEYYCLRGHTHDMSNLRTTSLLRFL